VTPHGTAEVTIVIADDDPLIRMVMRMALSPRPALVLEAATTQECLDLVESGPVDLVITDAHMAGPALADRISAFERARPGMPVLIVSGDSSLGSGPTPFLAKPVELDDLLHAVDALLDRPTEAP
jgi:two-component system, OmpR family, response regulator